MRSFIISVLFLPLLFFNLALAQNDSQSTIKKKSANTFWKAGVARSAITPKTNIWMAGYAARTEPAKGKIHDLWVKVLAIEDLDGNQVIFISVDLIGFSRETSMEMCNQIMKAHNLDRSQIILSSSHTHSGPVFNKNLIDIYPPLDEDQQKKAAAYKSFVKEEVIACASKAFEQLAPSRISSSTGIARFAVNRRNNSEKDVLHATALKGPSDHSVPVIAVFNPDNSVKAVVFGYACHATTLDGNLFSGDYPGFAQIEIEKEYPDATALFFTGCGADQNPIPRRSVPLAQQYGLELAASVKRVLKEPMKDLAPKLRTNYEEIELMFDNPLSMDELRSLSEDGPLYQQRWATHLIGKIDRGDIPAAYSYYPVQSWQLGEQTMVALGGEVVVDYAIRIKKTWGTDIFIVAYANDVMAYIPSERVLKEGGYEGDISMRVYGQPARWAPGIEQKIVDELDRQLLVLEKGKL